MYVNVMVAKASSRAGKMGQSSLETAAIATVVQCPGMRRRDTFGNNQRQAQLTVHEDAFSLVAVNQKLMFLWRCWAVRVK